MLYGMVSAACSLGYEMYAYGLAPAHSCRWWLVCTVGFGPDAAEWGGGAFAMERLEGR